MSSAPVQFLADDSQDTCQRCKEKRAVLVSRKERFCAECFVWFMRGKQRKQMLSERYKVKYGAVEQRLGTQRVLLPLSFGASSLVLFDMVASLLQEQQQAHKGKQGFELVVVHLLEGPSQRARFAELARRYEPVRVEYVEHTLDDYPVRRLAHICVSPEFAVVGAASRDGYSVAQLLDAAASKSSRADLRQVAYRDIFRATAVQRRCQTLLYGHNMTRLANEVIALTVTGRGSSIHEVVNDTTATYAGHELRTLCPLREVLHAEVAAVLRVTNHLGPYEVRPPAAPRLAKNMTVQELTTQYFDGLDATGYASTASTVVKTAEKLAAPREQTASCQVCGGAIHRDPRRWLQNITVNSAAPLTTDEERAYARQYSEQLAAPVEGDALCVCYGCTVTLAGAGERFAWPVRSTKDEVLAEYVLTDDE